MHKDAAIALFEEGMSSLDQRLLRARQWLVHRRDFPVLELSFQGLDHHELRLRLTFDDWDDSPPSVAMLAPCGEHLSVLPLPRRLGSNIFNRNKHPRTGRPFVCMAGVREYHEHPSHLMDVWSNYKTRGGYSIGGILFQLWSGWQRFWP